MSQALELTMAALGVLGICLLIFAIAFAVVAVVYVILMRK